jgi:NADH dehydrogenase [ubiquinone] 1 alpha subcomplex assembly factor 1
MATEDVRILLDFDDPAEVDGFSAIDDAVMGGVSSSRLVQAAPGIAAFEGRVSLENNGGFASVRSRPRDWGMAGATTLVLRLRAKAFGRAVPLVGPPDPAQVRQVGFMISDAQAGPFRLEIDWIGWK